MKQSQNHLEGAEDTLQRHLCPSPPANSLFRQWASGIRLPPAVTLEQHCKSEMDFVSRTKCRQLVRPTCRRLELNDGSAMGESTP